MKKLAIVGCVILLAACASSHRDDDETIVAAPPSPKTAPDVEARLAQVQTSMTELLERIDVLNERIAKLESTVAAGVPATAGAGPAEQRPVRREQPAQHPGVSAPLASARIADTYRGALVLFGQGKIAEARRTFQQVFDEDPTGDLADNALFWIGETYYQGGDFANAVRYYRRVTTEFAEQNKAPDALFKIALAQEKTGDLALARRTLDEVIQKYPYSSPAASAKYELKRIKY
jgi:tol-pal system protein YbgF